MISRRGFLTAALAAGVSAPYIKTENLMGLWVPKDTGFGVVDTWLSEDALENFLIDMDRRVDSQGFKIMVRPNVLMIPPEIMKSHKKEIDLLIKMGEMEYG